MRTVRASRVRCMQVTELEHEAAELRESLISKQTVVKSLERKVTGYEVEVQELQAKVGRGMRGYAKLQRGRRGNREGCGLWRWMHLCVTLAPACMAAQHQQAVEESHRLNSEKSLLIDTVKKLNREIAKLEAFKKNLLQTLQDGDEVRDHGACFPCCHVGYVTASRPC
eukprot:359913-Chlamydomonas_euryale.AAC.8